jgi:hypothetical protein
VKRRSQISPAFSRRWKSTYMTVIPRDSTNASSATPDFGLSRFIEQFDNEPLRLLVVAALYFQAQDFMGLAIQHID